MLRILLWGISNKEGISNQENESFTNQRNNRERGPGSLEILLILGRLQEGPALMYWTYFLDSAFLSDTRLFT